MDKPAGVPAGTAESSRGTGQGASRPNQGAMASRQVREAPERRLIPALGAGATAGISQGAMAVNATPRSRSVMVWPPHPDVTGAGAAPPLREPAGGLRPGASASGLSSAPAGRPAATPETGADAETAEVPWLSKVQNKNRSVMIRLFDSLQLRPDIPEHIKKDLSAIGKLALQVEVDILRVDELCRRSRTEAMSEGEWRKLAVLSARCVDNMAVNQCHCREVFDTLVKSGVLRAGDAGLLESIQQRITDAEQYLQSDRLTWYESARLMNVTLPIGAGSKVELESRVVPGSALGARFAGGYPAADSSDWSLVEKRTHVPNLALSCLVDSTGQRLFSGLRHDVIGGRGMDGWFLRQLSDDDLRTLLALLAVTPGWARQAGAGVAQSVESEFAAVRQSRLSAAAVAATLRQRACRRMAGETTVAALVADPPRLQQALAGESVELGLFCVALLNPWEVNGYRGQYEAFQRLQQLQPCELEVRGDDGSPRIVTANVRVRQFEVSMHRRGFNQEAFRKWHAKAQGQTLLGPSDEPGLGGDVKDRVDRMARRASRLSQACDSLQRVYLQAVREKSRNHPDARNLGEELAAATVEKNAHQRRLRALEEAGQQLKDNWIGHGDWPAGMDAGLAVAARLGFVAHLMGETPVFTEQCGRHFLRYLDPEVKFVAAVADKQGGRTPPLDPDMEIWGPARSHFANQ